MKKALSKNDCLVGQMFGRLEVIARSERRGSRGKRTVPLWECRCECGAITYKATDTLTNSAVSMCQACAARYATERMRGALGYVDGTQISRIRSDKPTSVGTSGARGVYFDRNTGKWRARLKYKGKLMSFGSYSNFEDAVSARKQAEELIYSEALESFFASGKALKK